MTSVYQTAPFSHENYSEQLHRSVVVGAWIWVSSMILLNTKKLGCLFLVLNMHEKIHEDLLVLGKLRVSSER